MWNYQYVVLFPLFLEDFAEADSTLSTVQTRTRTRLDSRGSSCRSRCLPFARHLERIHHPLHDRSRLDPRSVDDWRRRSWNDPRPSHVHVVLGLASCLARYHPRQRPPDVHRDWQCHHRPSPFPADELPLGLLEQRQRRRRLGSGDRHGRILHSCCWMLVPRSLVRCSSFQ